MNELFVPLFEKFNWEKVIVDEPTTHKFTKGKSNVEWTESKVYAEGENGAKLSIYCELAEQNVRGVNGIWPFALPKEQQTDNNLEGFQVCYAMMRENVKPNKAERGTQQVFDKMNDITVNAMKKFGEERKLPHPSYSSYLVAKEGKVGVDHNKPARVYIRLNTKGKGKNIECSTPIHGPGDKPLSPWKCKGVHGSCSLVVKWVGIFWGAHGRNSHGASIRLRVHEMNFTPRVWESRVPSRRMLPFVAEKEKEHKDEKDSEDELIISESDSDDDGFEFVDNRFLKQHYLHYVSSNLKDW